MSETHNIEPSKENVSGIRRLSGGWPWVPRVATLVLTLLTIDYLFNLQLINIVTKVESQFFYVVVALMLPLVFLLWPMSRHASRNKVPRSEEHTSELQSRPHLVCRLL